MHWINACAICEHSTVTLNTKVEIKNIHCKKYTKYKRTEFGHRVQELSPYKQPVIYGQIN